MPLSLPPDKHEQQLQHTPGGFADVLELADVRSSICKYYDGRGCVTGKAVYLKVSALHPRKAVFLSSG